MRGTWRGIVVEVLSAPSSGGSRDPTTESVSRTGVSCVLLFTRRSGDCQLNDVFRSPSVLGFSKRDLMER